jgi:hypothetical protein
VELCACTFFTCITVTVEDSCLRKLVVWGYILMSCMSFVCCCILTWYYHVVWSIVCESCLHRLTCSGWLFCTIATSGTNVPALNTA